MAEVHTAGPASAPLTYFRNPKTAAPVSETFRTFSINPSDGSGGGPPCTLARLLLTLSGFQPTTSPLTGITSHCCTPPPPAANVYKRTPCANTPSRAHKRMCTHAMVGLPWVTRSARCAACCQSRRKTEALTLSKALLMMRRGSSSPPGTEPRSQIRRREGQPGPGVGRGCWDEDGEHPPGSSSAGWRRVGPTASSPFFLLAALTTPLTQQRAPELKPLQRCFPGKHLANSSGSRWVNHSSCC